MSEDWIEYACNLYNKIQAYYEAHYNKKLTEETLNVIFEQVCSFDRGERAGAARQQVRDQQGEQQADPPTQRQLQYIKDLGGDPDKIKTKTQASQWIEENR